MPAPDRPSPEVGAVRRTAWGLRRWWWVAVLPVAAGVASAVAAAAEEPPADRRYEATALVVAQQLTIQAEELPRLAQAVFDGGAVARAVSSELGADIDPADLVPSRIDAEPVVGTIAIRVVGRSANADGAADLANVAADAFVDQLNTAGEGVGRFGVQASAAPPDAPVRTAPSTAGLLLIVGSGIVAAVALVGVVVAVRQPVLSGAEAAAAAGTRLVGSVRVPRRGPRSPQAMPGLDALARRLVVAPSSIALVGTGRDRGATERLAEALAQRIEERIPVRSGFPLAQGTASASTGDGATIAVVNDPSVDVPQLLGTSQRVYLVVTEGTARRAVARAVEPFAPGDLAGTIYLRRSAVEPRPMDEPVTGGDPGPVETWTPLAPVEDADPCGEVEVALVVRGEVPAYLSVGGSAFSFYGRGGVATPPIADVLVNDRGQAPPVRLPPGRYEVVQTAVAEGYEPAAPTLVDVRASPRSEPMALEVHNRAERGRLIVLCRETTPAGPVSLHYDFDNDGRYVCIVASLRIRAGIAAVDGLLPGAFRVVEGDHVVGVTVEAGRASTVTLAGPGNGAAAPDVDEALPES